METITFKINKRTKAGRVFLAMAEVLMKGNTGIEVVNNPNIETIKAMYEAKYNIGITKAKNTKDLMKKLRD